MNVNIAKLDGDRDNNRIWAPSSMGVPQGPSKNVYGKQYAPPVQKDEGDRISPDLLNAFRQNPYTHSLNYAV